jgi:hypothetical protein
LKRLKKPVTKLANRFVSRSIRQLLNLFDEETGKYNLRKEGRMLSSEEMVGFWKNWVDQYPIVSIEDGLAQDDWEGWKMMTAEMGDRLQIVGDDLLVTNPERVRRGIKEKPAMHCWSKSTRSAASPRPSKPFHCATALAGMQSLRTAQARPKTPPSPTWR